MRAKAVFGSLASIATLASFGFLAPVVVSFSLEERDFALGPVAMPWNAFVFLALFLSTLAFARGVRLLAGRPTNLRDIEGYVIVALGWLLVPALYGAPFLLAGGFSWWDALFEGMSGVTTTGFSVIADPNGLAPSLVFWRSIIQWFGGVGIAVLSVAVLARLTESGARLMRAELPGGSVTRLRPKIVQTARSLYAVYLTLSFIVFAMVFAALIFSERMPWQTAVWEGMLLTFTSIATGGFAPHLEGIAYYASPWVRHAILFGMLAGGTSLTLTWFASHGEPRRLLRDLEWRTFLGVLAAASVFLAAILLTTPERFWPGREAAFIAMDVDPDAGWASAGPVLLATLFHVTSIVTTTGFAYVDFDAWPEAARIVFLLLMFTGACVGSTAGGLKLARMIILAKVARREVQKLVKPNAYVPVRIGGAVVNEDTIRGVIAFLFAYMTLFIVSTIVVALFGTDVFTAASASAAAVGNVGLGLGLAGPCCTLADYHPFLKVWLTLVMWLGRLEIFAALLVFLPSTYGR